MQADFTTLTFTFKTPVGTSRGVMHERVSHFLKLNWYGRTGFGECAPLPGLSCDDVSGYTQRLEQLCSDLRSGVPIPALKLGLAEYPSLVFGLETALAQMATDGDFRLFDTPFSSSRQGIPINGLIWMGTPEYMLSQVEKKVSAGYSCLKFKVGALDFETELALLHQVRDRYPNIEMRLDANGGFHGAGAEEVLHRLSALGIHSIEQPIRAGHREEMAELCRNSPIPVALDEELIGVHRHVEKALLLDGIQPDFIVLKPSLHGGFSGCTEWIALAEERGIGWWLTSALESNIGLNAIAQFAATFDIQIPQGLGTGELFVENFTSPLVLKGEVLSYGDVEWKTEILNGTFQF